MCFATPTTTSLELPEGDFVSLPAVKLVLLAADKRAPYAGLRLLDWVINRIVTEVVPETGCRFLIVDAHYEFEGGRLVYDSGPFYQDKFDFVYADPNELPHANGSFRTMYLDLLPLVADGRAMR